MKQILSITAFVLITISATAQDIKPVDSARIDFLKKKLRTASGKSEVDLLNDIAWEYSWAGKDKTPMLIYASQAKDKAESIHYEKGIGYASLTLSSFYNVSNRMLSDSLFKTASAIAEKIKDARLIGWCYYKNWDLKKAVTYFRQAHDLEGEAEACTWLCSQYSTNTDNEADFSYCQRALELASVKKNSRISYNNWLSSFAYSTMVDMYNYVEDFQSAFTMLKMAEKYSSRPDLYRYYASTYEQMGKYDSSVYYYEKALEKTTSRWQLIRNTAYVNQRIGNFSRTVELLEESAKLFQGAEDLKMGTPLNWKGEIYSRLAQAQDSLGKRNEAIKNYEFALGPTRKAYQELKVVPKPGSKWYGYEGDRKTWSMNVSKDLSAIFSGLKQYDSAYYYLDISNKLKDSVDSKKRIHQMNIQLSNYKKAAEDQKRTSQLELLQKNNLLSQAKLKQETFMKNGLALGLLLLTLIGFFIFRTINLKRKNERLRTVQLENELKVRELESKQKQSELQQKASELEMQALRAQMNPHFIFNCLSSINRFVLKNETEAASDYLTRFSRLIRMVLINSQKPAIPLEDEMEMLRLYLDMERLRFKESFDYNITYSNTVDAGAIIIPPLLLQPFCENAIWHGLMHKEGHGMLNIVIAMEKNVLHCTITDDGIGRKKAAELKSKSGEKEKSLGLKITTDRLALLNESRDIQTFYEMHDLINENGESAGTKVDIKIKYKEEVTELV